ncbi:MAG: tripartite tricarboxylate transporter substrate binding protein [Betaproteobacteria bacterium]|nr:tripartite tricarboxylate transporter substrate binding protein [Betaproteobacteria bacterium]
MQKRSCYARQGAAFALTLTLAAAAGAQEIYPSKPVRLIAPFPPGGSTDVLCRIIAQKLSASFGQQVVVDNRPGAGGSIGHAVAARSPADGYTLLLTAKAGLVINPHLYTKLPFDPLTDFEMISQVISAGPVLVVHPSVPAKDVKALIALARARPGQLNYGSGGIGTTAHIAAEFLQVAANIKLTHIPYKGGAVALIDLVAGQTDLQFGDMVPSVPQIRTGKMRALAVTTQQRSAALPDTPTMAQAGVDVQFPRQWWGVAAPKGTPRAIVDRLNAELAKVVKAPDVLERFNSLGVFAEHTTPERMLEIVKEAGPRMGKLLRNAGIRPQ